MFLLCLFNRRLVVEVCLHSVWVPRTNGVRRRLVRLIFQVLYRYDGRSVDPQSMHLRLP